MDYVSQMLALIDEAYVGLDVYANQLEDLSGNVLDPIYSMKTLTEESYDLPEYVDREYVLSLLDEAVEGAESYAETLYDTTDCSYPLDQVSSHIQGIG